MSYLAALGQAGMAQEDRAKRAMEEEERQRLMAARRASDADMVTKRQRTEADYQAGRATSLDLPGLPTGNAKWPGPVAGAAAGAGTPSAGAGLPVTPAKARKTYTPPTAPTENQSLAETRRLAGKTTPETKLLEGGGGNYLRERDRFEQLKKLNPPVPVANQSAAESARLDRAGDPNRRPAQDAGFEAFKNAIFGQESGNGAVDTSRPNYAGALGKGQILQSTFEGLKQQGKIPANYQWTNPQHNEEAAVAYMREAWQASGGNPELAAAYYYGGPKAIAGGQINTYRDLKNPNAPTTNQYAQQVLQRMGQAATSVIPSAQAAPAPGLPAPQPVAIDRSALGGGTGVDDRELQYQRMVLADIQRRLQTAPTAEAQQTLITQARQLQLNIMNGELQGVAQRAQAGDPQAVDQLAQMAQVQYANTPQGLVTVTVDPYTGQGRAASQPMDVPTFSQMLFQRASSVARQAMAASSAKIAEQRAKTEGEIAVERERGVNALRTAMAQSQGRLQEEMLKHSLTQDQVKDVKAAGPLGREVIIVTRNDGAVFEVQPGGTVNGMTSPPRLVPIQ